MNRGLGLLETLLYMGLLVIILPLVGGVILFSVQSRVRGEEAGVVGLEGLRLTQIMTQAIRNADDINDPILGVTSSTISLKMTDANKNPTIFKLTGGDVTIKEGSGSEVILNSNKSSVLLLNFSNLSQPGTPGSIKIYFQLASGNYQKDFYATASLRQ